MLRKVLLSAAALIALAFAGVSTAQAGHGHCGHGHYGHHGHHGHGHHGGYGGYGYGGYGGYPSYRSSYYGPAYYGGPSYYGGSGVSYYQSRGGYGRSSSGIGISIGF
jgi:hypothetical protein